MTDLQLFGFFIAPLMLLAVGLAMAWFAVWQARHGDWL
jgi:hypothetical protein